MPKLCDNCGKYVEEKNGYLICIGCGRRFSAWEHQYLDDEITETGGRL